MPKDPLTQTQTYCPSCGGPTYPGKIHACPGVPSQSRRITTLEAAVIQLQEQCAELALHAGKRQGESELRIQALEGQKAITADNAEMFFLLHRIWDSEAIPESGWAELYATLHNWCDSHPNPGYPG